MKDFNLKKMFATLFVFAVAMGFLEAIIVVYIRELYYPEGFAFPLKPLPAWLIGIEIIREVCTLLMLGSVAWLTGKTFRRRLAAFLFVFGVWDIFYYVALWLFLHWPESLLTWDILFLIPVAWAGPVLAPVICSVLMILLAILYEWRAAKQAQVSFLRIELLTLLSGALVIFIAFIFDFAKILMEGDYLSQFFMPSESSEFMKEMTSYVPQYFQWELFIAGLVLIIVSPFLPVKRN